jgi:hypothetical protein
MPALDTIIHAIDRANKTWAELRMVIESFVQNSNVGTSCDPEIHNKQRDCPSRE